MFLPWKIQNIDSHVAAKVNNFTAILDVVMKERLVTRTKIYSVGEGMGGEVYNILSHKTS